MKDDNDVGVDDRDDDGDEHRETAEVGDDGNGEGEMRDFSCEGIDKVTSIDTGVMTASRVRAHIRRDDIK